MYLYMNLYFYSLFSFYFTDFFTAMLQDPRSISICFRRKCIKIENSKCTFILFFLKTNISFTCSWLLSFSIITYLDELKIDFDIKQKLMQYRSSRNSGIIKNKIFKWGISLSKHNAMFIQALNQVEKFLCALYFYLECFANIVFEYFTTAFYLSLKSLYATVKSFQFLLMTYLVLCFFV